MRDDDADPAEPPEGAHEERPAFRVEMVRWLVEQEDVRLHGERGADLPALALARRERRPAFEGSAVGASRLLKRASVERRCVSCFGMTSCPERPALRGLAGIVDLPVRIGAVARHVRTSPDAFVAQLERLIVESGLGSNAAAEAVVACALWLLDQDDARVSELGTLAVRDGHGLVSALLAEAAPHRGLARGGRLAPLDIRETARVRRYVFTECGDYPYLIDGLHYAVRWSLPPLPRWASTSDGSEDWTTYCATLVEQCAGEPHSWRPLSPVSVRRAVARLGQHPSAFVIGRLLDDPSTRERDVIAIAARRPTTPAIVRQITSRARWMHLPGVRAALLANPGTPTRVALLLAVTCLPRLRGIATRGNVHPRVRDLARLVRAHEESHAARAAG